MSPTSTDRITLTGSQRRELTRMTRAGRTEQRLVTRAQIVLAAAAGESNAQIARWLGICEDTVRKWRRRWCVAPGVASLADAKRSGRPPVFSPVQVARVKAMACTPPKDKGLPLSRWSCPELAERAITDGICRSISPATVRRWLSQDALKPWQYQSWILITDPDFAVKAQRVLDLYDRTWDGTPLGRNDNVISADAQQLASLDETGRARLEEEWDRTMPLFPSRVRNPDLSIAVSYCGFRTIWTQWFEGLGLSGITTHQTRATLATSLLNNGAPAALVRQLLGHISDESLAHYARYNDASMIRHLQQVWAAGPGTDKPGAILLRPGDLTATDGRAITTRIDLSVVPVEHGLCRYGPVVGGKNCPFNKNCTTGPLGPCEHFVLTGADLAYWERKREAAFHFAEGAPTEEARDYILSQWHPWEPVLAGLRQALDELGLLEEAEQLDLRSPAQDYFNPLFSAGWAMTQLNSATNPTSTGQE
jgi:transposase